MLVLVAGGRGGGNKWKLRNYKWRNQLGGGSPGTKVNSAVQVKILRQQKRER